MVRHSTERPLSCLLGLGVQELVRWCDTVQQDHCLGFGSTGVGNMAQYYGKTAVLSLRFGSTGVGNVAQHNPARLPSCLLGLGVQCCVISLQPMQSVSLFTVTSAS